MARCTRRIALVCMTPVTDANELGDARLPSYGIRRILAAIAADPELEGSRITMIDFGRSDARAYVDAITAIEPDLVGFSIYVWSTPCMVDVAREVKRRLPRCTIVFGGPSARTALFELPPYAEPHTYLDAVVSSDGEFTFREIAHLPELSRSGLESVQGLDLPDPSGWTRTGSRAPLLQLDDISSPFQLGLMSRGTVAYLETFRGCPLSCSFCEWGATEGSKAVFSTDYLVRELEAFAELGAPAVFLLDAGLNLNARGFRNLCEAEARVGFLKSIKFWCEIYPTLLRDEHIEFLTAIGPSYLGVGLQSLDPDVLKAHERPFDRHRFEANVPRLASLSNVELQIIFGLPGDSPDGFRRTLEYARSFSVGVRAYHCLVLPDALMTRGRPEWDIQFDPLNLTMISCRGWAVDDFQEMRGDLTREALASGGAAGNFWWFFPGRS
jgi:radical SAM superfamily enzyme YgiQ (UPF0313 family)